MPGKSYFLGVSRTFSRCMYMCMCVCLHATSRANHAWQELLSRRFPYVLTLYVYVHVCACVCMCVRARNFVSRWHKLLCLFHYVKVALHAQTS